MTSALVLSLGILSTSFLGSIHCAGMCGPMATLMAQRKSLLPYHLGRLCLYSFLGFAAGWGGQFFLSSSFSSLRLASTILMALLLFLLGIIKFFPHLVPSTLSPTTIGHRFFSKIQSLYRIQSSRSGFMIGLMTGLLPCGWLYTYVLAAAATQSPWAGALTLFLFWAGGLPALSALPLMIRQGVKSTAQREQKIIGAILIAASLYSLVSFFFIHG